jgi:hypothetical protein
LPEGYGVVSSSGVLERIRDDYFFDAGIRDLQPSEQSNQLAVTGPAGANAETGNYQQASNLVVVTARTSGKQAGPAAVYAGSKPQLPARFYFQGLILNPDVPAGVTALCMAGPTRHLLLGVTVLLVFGACALVWRKVGLPPLVLLAVFIASVLLLVAAKVAAEQEYAPFLNAVVLTVAGAGLLFCAISVGDRIVQRFRPTEE